MPLNDLTVNYLLNTFITHNYQHTPPVASRYSKLGQIQQVLGRVMGRVGLQRFG